MNQLFIFFHSDHDLLGVVNNARDRANAKAEELTKQLSVVEVDLRSATAQDKTHFSGGSTIECVLVVDGNKKTSFIFNSPQQIDDAVRSL